MKKEKKTTPIKKISIIKSDALFKDLLTIANMIKISNKEVDSDQENSWKISPLLKKITIDFITNFDKEGSGVHPIKDNDVFIKFKKDYEVAKASKSKITTFDLPLKEHSHLEKIARQLDMAMAEIIKSIFFNYLKSHEAELKAGREILDKLNKSSKIKKEVRR